MPRFVTFFSYTSEALAAMIDQPRDRSAAVKALVESLGGTMEAFYWMQGSHDGFLISEVPDSVAGTALVAAVASTGAVTDLESHEIFDAKQQSDVLRKAKLALSAYRPPTG